MINMKKVKIFIVSIPLILMLIAVGYRTSIVEENNNTLLTLNCNLNDKLYSYEII